MSLRPVLLAAAALVAAIGSCLALYGRGAEGNPDLSGLARAVGHGEELESHAEARRRRDEAKRALAAEVVDGRMTVREAADQFRRLDEAASDYPASIPRPPGYEQILCHRVLDSVWVVFEHQQRYATAARWFAAAFAAHPDLLPCPPTGPRYNAARAAVLAGCGQGRDAAGLDERSGAGFRRQALGWLRDELEAQRRLLETEKEPRWSIAGRLRRWLRDPYLAGVRDPDALGRLPEPERQAWQKLWAEVADTLARAEGATPPEPKAGDKIPLPER
jgi:hypothetical protein